MCIGVLEMPILEDLAYSEANRMLRLFSDRWLELGDNVTMG